MIELGSAVSLSFLFPARLALAYAYYTDLQIVLQYLPHIKLLSSYSDTHFRLLYSSTEFGGYTMHIYCDIRATLDGGRHMMRIAPEESLPPVEARAGINSSAARGHFSSRALFSEAEAGTRVEYEFQLQSKLPRPIGMRLMPARVVNSVARQVAKIRMREIAQGFVTNSIERFPEWREQYEADSPEE